MEYKKGRRFVFVVVAGGPEPGGARRGFTGCHGGVVDNAVVRCRSAGMTPARSRV